LLEESGWKDMPSSSLPLFNPEEWINRLISLEKAERARGVYTSFFLRQLARYERNGSDKSMNRERICIVLEVDPATRQFIALTAERAIERLLMIGEFTAADHYEKLLDEEGDWKAIYYLPGADRRPGIKAVRRFAREKEEAQYDTDISTDTSDEEETDRV
jgi:hypothetical protein